MMLLCSMLLGHKPNLFELIKNELRPETENIMKTPFSFLHLKLANRRKFNHMRVVYYIHACVHVHGNALEKNVPTALKINKIECAEI